MGRQRKEGFAGVARGSDRCLRVRSLCRADGQEARKGQGITRLGILEIVEDWRGNAYRAVYTVRFSAAVFVLHVFQKRAKHGIATPRQDMELIREPLKVAEQMAKELAR
jgi:phage-related protein